VDRIVLNASYPLGHNPGGFRTGRRWHSGSDAELDNTHLMRLTGRLARRVRAWAAAHGIPVLDCGRGERKPRIAEQYRAAHEDAGIGVFLILVAKAPATVWQVLHSPGGVLLTVENKRSDVNHSSLPLRDRQWGHVTIKMSGHPPFGAQVLLKGHEYLACPAQAAGIPFRKDGNCVTAVTDPDGLAQVADTLAQPAAIGRLSQVCDRWIYRACRCFGRDRVPASGFRSA
jgi:hypothetical protein